MKFSVLLPTRNRLEFLRYAVETVRRQDYDDWELIISDNCSTDPIEAYVTDLHEPRIVYYRTDSAVPVTDNWNNALEKSTGDYVIMLGDDDGLQQGYFTTVQQLLTTYHAPDLIYTKALQYIYPNVLPSYPNGCLVQPYNHYPVFTRANGMPYCLEQSQAQTLARHSMDFRCHIVYNMQCSLISRRLIDALRPKGPFFQSLYPDYYATNVLFLTARQIVVYPQPIVVIGISPKSFGFYYFNDIERQGTNFLNNVMDVSAFPCLKRILLPGTDLNDSWLLALETVKANYGAEYGLRVNYQRYRFRQLGEVYKRYYRSRALSAAEFQEIKQRMNAREQWVYTPLFWLRWNIKRILQQLHLPPKICKKIYKFVGQFVELIDRTYPDSTPEYSQQHYNNMLDVFEHPPLQNNEASCLTDTHQSRS